MRTPEEIFRSAMDAVERGDIPAVLEHYHPGCTFTDMSEGFSRSHADLRPYLEAYYEHLPITELRVVSVVAEGNRLASELEVDGLYTGEGSAPGGTPITLHYVVLDEYEDGLIKSERVYADSAELTNQL